MRHKQFVQCAPHRLASGWHTDPTEDPDPWGYLADYERGLIQALPTFRLKQHVQVALHGQIVHGQIVERERDLGWRVVRIGSKRVSVHVSRLCALPHTC
jgi:hypothetical protein